MRLTLIIILIIGSILRLPHTAKKDKILNKLSIDTVLHNGERIAYETALVSDSDYSLVIKTVYIYNNTYINHDWVSDLNNVVVSQEIIFKHKKITISHRNFNARTYAVRESNRTTFYLDNVIREIALVKGSKGKFYKIYGFGGCNSCSEFLGYFSLDGKLLYKVYSSKMDNYSYKYGSINDVMNSYGVMVNDPKKHTIETTTVFPPKYSGKIQLGIIN